MTRWAAGQTALTIREQRCSLRTPSSGLLTDSRTTGNFKELKSRSMLLSWMHCKSLGHAKSRPFCFMFAALICLQSSNSVTLRFRRILSKLCMTEAHSSSLCRVHCPMTVFLSHKSGLVHNCLHHRKIIRSIRTGLGSLKHWSNLTSEACGITVR